MKNNKKIKFTNVLLTCITILVLMILVYPLDTTAHPASNMNLSYNSDDNLLNVTINHQVSDPETHYIYEIRISKNGGLLNSYNYSNQPTKSSFTYSYEIDATKGDVIEVYTDCNLGGSLTEKLTVSPEGEPSQSDSYFSIQNIAFYSILGVPFIVYLGIITLFVFVLTAVLALLKRRGKIKISIKWHFWLAYLAIILGFIHGILGVLAYI